MLDVVLSRTFFHCGEARELCGGDDSACVIGVQLAEPFLSAVPCWFDFVLKREDEVLVELAEPTPFNRSPCAVSVSSGTADLESVQRWPLQIPLVEGRPSPPLIDGMGCAADVCDKVGSCPGGDLGRFRL